MSVTFSSFLLLCLSSTLFSTSSTTILAEPQNDIVAAATAASSPYLSPITLSRNYQNMLNSFKIFIYKPNKAFAYNSPAESLFYASLRNSPFATQNAEEAHLFFVPFPSNLSLRSISRIVSDLRTTFPYWDRTLGADHVFLTCGGVTVNKDRNILELSKNSIQISCFPTPAGKFIPHKDITLPPLTAGRSALLDALPPNATASFLGYLRDVVRGDGEESAVAKALTTDPDFLIDSAPSDQLTYTERASTSKFCLFKYGADVSMIGEALGLGCVPAVVTDRPIQDLPFMDVLRWQEIAVFVGVEDVKRVLDGMSGELYERMRRLGMAASKHFVWHESPEPFDCFNTLMYQLWLRRHSIRYVLRS